MKIGRVACNTRIWITLCFILKANVNVPDVELHGWLSLKLKNKSQYYVGSYVSLNIIWCVNVIISCWKVNECTR